MSDRECHRGVTAPPVPRWRRCGGKPSRIVRRAPTCESSRSARRSSQRTARAAPGRWSVLSGSHSRSVFYGTSVWACRALHSPKRRFSARAVTCGDGNTCAASGPQGACVALAGSFLLTNEAGVRGDIRDALTALDHARVAFDVPLPGVGRAEVLATRGGAATPRGHLFSHSWHPVYRGPLCNAERGGVTAPPSSPRCSSTWATTRARARSRCTSA